MANHPFNQHREQQVSHRRVNTILSGSPPGAKQHAEGAAFSKITSKSAASRDDDVRGHSSAKRFARGGKVKGKGDTNIAIVMPGGGKPPLAGGGPMLGPPPGAPGMPPPPGGPGPMMPPPGAPPMPMRASGGKVNSYARGGMTAGAESGVGRLQLSAIQKRKR